MQCPRCNTFDLPDLADAPPPHDKKVICHQCGYCFGFIAKPKNKEKLDHRPNGCPTPDDLKINHCQICLRHRGQIGKGHLETHHIDNDPANNDRLNLLVVCIACHKLIHWARTYIRNHMTDGE
jgi:hypothetical protein